MHTTTFNVASIPSQKGKIAIVTGANTGLGFQTSLTFAKKEIKVIMACRNEQKAKAAMAKIKKEVPHAKLEFIAIDLMDLSSVRKFAATFLKEYQRLDLLINNAGIMIPPFQKTKDGFESQMGVNYLSHFLLTGLLMEVLNNTPNARVVTLSSKAHETGVIDFDNLNSEKSYSKFVAYGQSKLACLLFTQELNRRLKKAHKSTISVGAHPGVSTTDLGRHIPKIPYYLLMPIFVFMTHKPAKGALPTIMAALDNEVQGGDYFGPIGFKEMKGPPAKVMAKPRAYDKEVAAKLWTVSEELTHFKFDI
ncbi:short-chain dehydrogenase [Putridiphycobacter roseus]|uniref:Short-chain dehydrogenase n=1 Tax=Putridiphycobacter roseus TaxID=2219161 RepID=A0A2W1N3I5_9FLAO|nr:oxidoreductase [Putridiphycobacter roseus]PZE18130.1 short-chain dehydrogenase [Putridiphycobacter roseus]